MRNHPDTARVAQSLDDERLMGCLLNPGKMIFPSQFDHKNHHAQRSIID